MNRTLARALGRAAGQDQRLAWPGAVPPATGHATRYESRNLPAVEQALVPRATVAVVPAAKEPCHGQLARAHFELGRPWDAGTLLRAATDPTERELSPGDPAIVALRGQPEAMTREMEAG